MTTRQTTRRAILAGAAAVPVTAAAAASLAPSNAVAAPPTGDDPIFAAIEKYQTSDAAFLARCDYEDAMKAAGNELAASPDGFRTPEMAAVVTASRAARAELANTSPTTLPGLSAYLDFVISKSVETEELVFEGSGGDADDQVDEQLDFVRSLQRAVRQIARQAVRS